MRCEKYVLICTLLLFGGCASRKRSKEAFHNEHVPQELIRAGDDTLVAPAAYAIKNEKIDGHTCTSFLVKSSIDMLSTYYRDELERLGWDMQNMVVMPHEFFIVNKKPYKYLLVHAFDGSVRLIGGSKKSEITTVRLFFS